MPGSRASPQSIRRSYINISVDPRYPLYPRGVDDEPVSATAVSPIPDYPIPKQLR